MDNDVADLFARVILGVCRCWCSWSAPGWSLGGEALCLQSAQLFGWVTHCAIGDS